MHAAYYASYKITQNRCRRVLGGVTPAAALARAEKELKRHLEALTSGLVEFQKSQCFFAATLQVAALIVLTPYLQQVQEKNQILLRLAAANSFAPIMLTLTHIEILAGRNSKYLLILASICFILGPLNSLVTPSTRTRSIRTLSFQSRPAAIGHLSRHVSCGTISFALGYGLNFLE